MEKDKNFAIKSRLELIRFSAMLEYHIYAPLASKLHFVPFINFLCEIGLINNNNVNKIKAVRKIFSQLCLFIKIDLNVNQLSIY